MAGYGFLQRDRSAEGDGGSPLPLPGAPDPTETPENSGYGLTGELLPVASLTVGGATLEARTGVAAYHSAFADEAFTRTVGVSDARVTLSPAPTSLVSAELRHVRADEASYPYAGATALLGLGPLSVWGSAGHWFSDAVDTTPWAVGASAALGSRLELTGSVRQDAFEPLYQSLPRRSWSVGLSLALGPRATVARPVPTSYESGRATLELEADDAPGTPSVAGDFTDWEPAPMTRVGGTWRWTGPLEPGVYHFAFVTADGEWFVPEGYPGRQADGMGGWVAVLVVEEGA